MSSWQAERCGFLILLHTVARSVVYLPWLSCLHHSGVVRCGRGDPADAMLEVESTDRVYLTSYQLRPEAPVGRAYVLHGTRGNLVCPSIQMTPMIPGFVAAIERFVWKGDLDLTRFRCGESNDERRGRRCAGGLAPNAYCRLPCGVGTHSCSAPHVDCGRGSTNPDCPRSFDRKDRADRSMGRGRAGAARF